MARITLSDLITGIVSTDATIQARIDAATAALVGAAPGALDTLNELAAALNDDANYAATITTALAGKQAAATAVTKMLPSGDHSGVTDTANLVAAASSLMAPGSTGGTLNLAPAGSTAFYINPLALTGYGALKVKGAGRNATSLVVVGGNTSDVFDLTNAPFVEFSDMTVNVPTQKTAGALFLCDNAGGSSQEVGFRKMRIASGFRAFQLGNCTTHTLDDIQFVDYNPAWTQDFLIGLTGTATSLTLNNINCSLTSPFNHAGLWMNGAQIDTVVANDINMVMQAVCCQIDAGEWIFLNSVLFESGTAFDALKITGGRGININGYHLLGLNGATVSGSPYMVTFNEGEAVVCRRHGISIAGGTQVKVLGGLNAMDIGQDADNTYSAVSVAAGVTDFTIADVTAIVHDHTNKPKYGVEVVAGASDRYKISDIKAPTGVTPIGDFGTGKNKTVINLGSPLISGTATRFYPAAVGQDYSGDSLAVATRTLAVVLNNLVVAPMYSGPRGLTISALSVDATVGASTAVYRAGVWKIVDQTDPFAWTSGTKWATLLSDIGVTDSTFDVSSAADRVITLGTPLVIPPMTWFAIGGVLQVATGVTLTVGNTAAGLLTPFGLGVAGQGVKPTAFIALQMSGVTAGLGDFTPTGGAAAGHGIGFHRSA